MPAPASTPAAALQIDASLCQLCRRCAAQKACRHMAIIRIDQDEPPFIDTVACRLCLLCRDACPYGAVQLGAS